MQGTQVVLEVRPHDVPFLIHDGQTFFKVVYDQDARTYPTQLYGDGAGLFISTASPDPQQTF